MDGDFIRFELDRPSILALIAMFTVIILGLTAYQYAIDKSRIDCRIQCTRPVSECKEICK